ncbi:adaptin ear-binding coat-associated protein 1-like [Oscarella lobularis]|uniref:adaptin ear-binding coat-associated protein 1-like n=1 Tax=Oscarella lobularis TaxID=121494 RepID=UPI0033142688
MGDGYESILCVKPEVYIYRIPPRTSTRGYRAADWNLEKPDWTGRMKIVAKGKNCTIKLEDKTSGNLFAACPVDNYPGSSVEAVLDSSRYFVLKIVSDDGKHAFIGIGFSDRADSFDFNVALQDHFKWLKTSDQLAKQQEEWATQPGKDYSLKEGQTFSINIGGASSTSKPKATTSGGLGLPPPPGKIPTLAPPPVATATTSPSLFPDSSSFGEASSDWSDFTSAPKQSESTASQNAWVKF